MARQPRRVNSDNRSRSVLSKEKHFFRCPRNFEATGNKIKRVLLVGSCTVSLTSGNFKMFFDIDTHFVHVGQVLQFDVSSIDMDFDYQLTSIPMDAVMHINSYLNSEYSDLSATEKRFEESVASLRRLLHDALRFNRERGLLTFVCNFLVPQQNPMGRLMPRYDLRNHVHYVEKLNECLANELAGLKNVFLIDVDAISANHGKRLIQDDSIWKLAHGGVITDSDFNGFETLRHGGNQRIEPIRPISEHMEVDPNLFWNALCAESIAMARTIRQVDPVKIVIIDLDDTLWRGVIAEESIIDHGFLLEGLHLGLVETLSFLKKRGILLAIASKNDHEKIVKIWDEVFGKHFPIENFVSIKINWNRKSENIKEILSEVNLLARNAVFIDDNPREREEVSAAFEGIRILGADPYEIRRVLLWSAETQVSTVTEESGRRTEMVQKQIVRDSERASMSREDFLKSLNIIIRAHHIKNAEHQLFPRSVELINKTNQFNTTGRRWSAQEISNVLENGGAIYAFEVEDRFTKYGTVIVSLVQSSDIHIFVMSCRVIGLDVELAALAYIANDALHLGIGRLSGHTKTTDANVLSRDLFSRAGYVQQESKWILELNEDRHIPEHIRMKTLADAHT